MMKALRKMLSVIIVTLVLTTACFADTIGLGGSGGVATYAGSYVGPIQGTFNGAPVAGGVVCNDFSTTSYFGTSWGVSLSTLDPVNLTNSMFGPSALGKYQQAGWLLGQIPGHSGQVGEIQFAIWRIFEPGASYPSGGRNIPLEDAWMKMAGSINPINYDFSSVKIYTAIDTRNQEFMSGAAAAPLPSTFLLVGAGGLLLLAGQRKRHA
jgi:hypothetical protein